MASLIKDFPWTDAGNSERLIKEHGENVRYIEAWENWIAWHGSRWEVDRGYLYRMAELVARKMHEEADSLKARAGKEDEDENYKKAAKAFARKSESATAIEAMLKLARYRAGVALHHNKLDGQHMLLPVRNGTIDLVTGIARNPKREDYATLNIPIKYDPKAECPKWEGFLLRAMGKDQDTVDFLQRCVGYSLTGSVAEHVLFFCHGPKGMNGKSTFLGILRELMGGYGATAPRKMLFQGIGERHPTELTVLFGKRLVTCSEVPKDQRFDEALVKDLTGGERISAHRMREDFWEFDPTHKFWIAGNYKPRIMGTDGGIWRRIVFVPWEVTIPEEERDLELMKKLRGELPGILAWAVRGCMAWQKSRLAPPGTVVKATMKYRRESDQVGEFIRQCCIYDPDARVTRSTLRVAYEKWCTAHAVKPWVIGVHRTLLAEGCTATSFRDRGKNPEDAWKGVRLYTAEEIAAKRWDLSE